MNSSMISHGSHIPQLSVPDKPSIEGMPQLLIQSEHNSIAITPKSSDLASESQFSNTVSIISNKDGIISTVNHPNLSYSGNVQKFNMDVNSSKILSSSITNSPLNSRVMSPPILSESCSDSIQGSASIRGNDMQSSTKFQNEDDSVEEKPDLQLPTKVETNNPIENLRDISTPSPPHVPYNESEGQVHIVNPEVITAKNYIGEKLNGYEHQNSPVFYQNGYSVTNFQESVSYPLKNGNQYYSNVMQGNHLYSQFSHQNSQFVSPNRKNITNTTLKQQKNLRNQKIQFQQMFLWQSQHQNQQYPQYQYFRYGQPQMPTVNYNIYGNCQQVAPMKNDLTSSYQHPSNLKPNIYPNGQINPIPYSMPYSLPSQEPQQKFLSVEDSNLGMNEQNGLQSNFMNHDSTMSSKMNLMMNNYSSKQENDQHPLSKSEPSMQNRSSKSKSKSLLKQSSVKSSHYHHHHITPNTELTPPKPIYYNDKELGRYGIRCICGKGSITIGNESADSNSSKKAKKTKKNKNKSSSELEVIQSNEETTNSENFENESETTFKNQPNSIKTTTLLVQCSICHFWLHCLCVNIAQVHESDSYVCPFCENKRIFCTKCGENMNYSDPLIKCTKCGYWVHKECEGLLFGINPKEFICRNCGGLGDESIYNIPYVNFLDSQKHPNFEKNPTDITLFLNKNENNDESENDEVDLDTFYDMEIPNNTVFTSSFSINNDEYSRDQIIELIPDGVFKKMVIYDLNKSELEFRPTIEKYFHTFAPLLFDYSHEFWRIFKDVICKLFNCGIQILLKSIDSLANHLIYMPTIFLSIKQNLKIDNGESDSIFYQSPKTKTRLFANSESITKYLEGLNMTRIEKQPKPAALYCKKSDGRVYSTASLDENAFIIDIPGFLMHTDEVRVEENGIPKTCFLVTDMDLVIDTKGTDFEYFAPRIRRGFHFNTVVKLVRIQGEIRLCLFAMKMKTLLSSEEKLKKGPAILQNDEIILPLDGTIPFPVKKIQWKDKKKHVKHINNNDKSKESNKLNSSFDSFPIKNDDDGDIIESDDDDENDSNSSNLSKSNQSIIMTRNQEKRKRAELKLEKKNRDEQISKLSLLSSFYDDSVQAFPFILLDDDEAVEKYKSQMEMKALKLKNGKGKR